MRKAVLGIGCIAFLATAFGGQSVDALLSPSLKRSLQKETTVMIDLLQGYHYSDRNFNSLEAVRLVDAYLEELDPEKMTLLAGDVAFIHRRFDRNLKTVYLFRGDVQPAYEIFDRLAEKIRARSVWVRKTLVAGFDLSSEAAQSPSGGAGDDASAEKQSQGGDAAAAPKDSAVKTKTAWAKSEAELDRRWEKRLRRDILNEVLRGRSVEEAIKWVGAYYEARIKRLHSWDALVVREVFLNSLFRSFDAHSGYFSKESSQAFNQYMTGSELGVGVDLGVHEGHVHVAQVVPGSPADSDGRIIEGARLWALKEAEGERQDVSTWTLRDVFSKMQGEAGTKLTLWLGDETGTPLEEITLERSRHARLDGHSRAALIEVPSAAGGSEASSGRVRKVGVISVPAFYHNEEGSGSSTGTSAEVRALLQKLKAQGAEALVLDLRENGGGVMQEALQTAGLFIKTGPLFLSRGLDRKVSTMEDKEEEIVWAGPLVILISGNTASASEALSGALQWYGRALVVGSAQTFGKGSAQDYMDLRVFADGQLNALQKEWGVLRLTRQLFYFPDGRSPQLDGVKAAIELPVFWRDRAGQSELEQANALPNEQVEALSFVPQPGEGTAVLDASLVGQLKGLAEARLETLEEFKVAGRALSAREKLASMDGVPLVLEPWCAAGEAWRKERIAADREWEELMARERFPETRIELDEVIALKARHLLAVQEAGKGKVPRLGRIVGGVYFYKDKQGGGLIDVSLDQLDYEALEGMAGALSKELAATSRVDLSEEMLRCFIKRLKLAVIEDGERVKPPIIFSQVTEGLIVEEDLEAVTRTVIDQLVEADGGFVPERFRMDVRRREAVRIARDWAQLNEEQNRTKE